MTEEGPTLQAIGLGTVQLTEATFHENQKSQHQMQSVTK